MEMDELDFNEAIVDVSSLALVDITTDLSLSLVNRIKKYINSSALVQKLAHVSRISTAVSSIGLLEAKHELFGLFPSLAVEPNADIRLQFAFEVQKIARLFPTEVGTTLRPVFNELVQVLQILLQDNNHQIQNTAKQTLVIISHLFTDIFTDLLPIVLFHAHHENYTQRVLCASLINLLAPVFAGEIFSQFIIPEFINLAQDENYKVRKTVASNCDRIVLLGGLDTVTQVVSTLSEDTLWMVRRSCAEHLTSLTMACDYHTRTSFSLPLCRRFLQDEGQFVRQAMLCNLPNFIMLFKPEDIPMDLFKLCVLEEDSQTNLVLEQCLARSMGALLSSVGDRWHIVWPTFCYLCELESESIMLNLATQMDLIAAVAATSPGTVNVFLLLYTGLWSNELFHVTSAALNHLGDILVMLEEPERLFLLQGVELLVKKCAATNWRIRAQIANQFQKAGARLEGCKSKQMIHQLLLSFLPSQLEGTVLAVGRALGSLFPELEEVLPKLGYLDISSRVRQTYFAVTRYVIPHATRRRLYLEIVPALLHGVNDRVINVRIQVGNCVSALPDETEVKKMLLAEIARDKDSDVRDSIVKTDDYLRC